MNDQTPAPIDDEYVEQALRDAADQRHDLPDWAHHRMSNLANGLKHARSSLAGKDAEITRLREALAFAEAPMDIHGATAEQEKWMRAGMNGLVARLRAQLGVESLAAALPAPARESRRKDEEGL